MRFCGILQSLKNVCKILNNAPQDIKNDLKKDDVSSILIDFANSLKVESSLFVVEDDTIEQAESLVKYFTCHKLNLSLYNFDFENSDLYNEIDKYIDSFEHSNLLTVNVAKVMCKILNSKEKIITTMDLNKKARIGKELALEAFNNLQHLNFGETQTDMNPSNHKETVQFVKKLTQNDKNITVDEIRSMFIDAKRKNSTITNFKQEIEESSGFVLNKKRKTTENNQSCN